MATQTNPFHAVKLSVRQINHATENESPVIYASDELKNNRNKPK